MNEDGVLDVELIEATMPDELKKHGGVETVKKCSHIKEDDMCETAYKLILCFQKENPELTALFEWDPQTKRANLVLENVVFHFIPRATHWHPCPPPNRQREQIV